MKEFLITWKPVEPIPSGTSVVRRIYRWGSYVGILCKNEWNVEQRTLIQETPILEECISVSRAAPPATVDDAWEETYIDHGTYQSVEGSLLQIRITSKNYKKQIMTAIALGCPIDSSTLRICETMEETPVSRSMLLVPPLVSPVVPQHSPLVSPVVPQGPSLGDRRQPQEGRRSPQEGRKQPQGDRRQTSQRSLLPQDAAPRDWKSVRSRPNGGVHRAPLAAAPVHRTLSLTPSGWLGTEE